MKAITKNFKGKITFDYKIRVEMPGESDSMFSEYATVYLDVKNPVSGEYELMSSAMGDDFGSTKDRLKSAFKRAKEKWGIELIREEVEILQHA